jgi:hypothetical protein
MAACARLPLWEETAGAFKQSFRNGTHLFESLIGQKVHVKSHVEILTYATSHFLVS